MVKILTIDDNEINLELIVEILKKQPNTKKVFTALSGNEGIEIAKKEMPDIILLDIRMPDLDGFEVCQLLKNNKVTQYIPIVMVSALGKNTEDRIKSLNAGADAIIAKPFNPKELVSQINVMLRIKFAEDTLRRQNEIQSSMLKEQAKEFAESEGRYIEISDYALEFFWEINKDGFFTFISPVVEKILGYSIDEIVEKVNFIDFFIATKKISTRKKLSSIFLKKEYFRDLEVETHNKNSKVVWLKINGFPIFDVNKEFTGFRGVCHDISQRKKTEEELSKSLHKINKYQKKLRSLNSRMIRVEENERRKVAEYLHDGVGQTLSIAQINLSSLLGKKLPNEIHEMISTSIELISESIHNTRMLTLDLSPPILYELGLAEAIAWKLDEIEQKYNIITKFETSIKSINFDLETRAFIFRIISELLVNTIKHANANKIEVLIDKTKNFYNFTIIDHGKGFVFNKSSFLSKGSGFGLFSINERIENMNGKFVIKSKPGSGTKIIVSLPSNLS